MSQTDTTQQAHISIHEGDTFRDELNNERVEILDIEGDVATVRSRDAEWRERVRDLREKVVAGDFTPTGDSINIAVDEKATPEGVPEGYEYIPPDEEPPEDRDIVESDRGATYVSPEPDEEDGSTDTGGTESFGGLEKSDPINVETVSADFQEQGVAADYIAGGYQDVNNALRRDGENYRPEVEETIETMSDLIDRAPEFEETTVFRGFSSTSEREERFKQAEGDWVQLEGFQSTSLDPDTADNFTGDGRGIMLTITTEQGLPMSALEGVDDAEDEVLLDEGSFFKIADVTETDDGLLVELE